METSRLFALSISLLLSTVSLVATATESPASEIDAIFADYDHTNTPGCALGVIRDGELIYKRGYGLAIALLAEAGTISLDDPIAELF